MKKVKKYWMVVLLGGLLMATLVGVAGARPDHSAMAAVTRRITIPAGHFSPHDDDDLWYNAGEAIWSRIDGSNAYFYAPVVFPTGQSVVVESVTFYAYDNNASANACLRLYLTDPTAGNEGQVAYLCSTGSSSTDPRTFTTSTISNNPAKHGKGVYLEVEFQDKDDLKLYGVRIQYHHGTT
jgi:hypothetical protein